MAFSSRPVLTGKMPKKPNPSTRRAQQIRASCPEGSLVTFKGCGFAFGRRSGVVSQFSVSAFREADILRTEVADEPVFIVAEDFDIA